MCKLDNCFILFYCILIFCHIIKLVLSIIITVDTGFGEDVVLLSTFSLLCAIITFIAFIFSLISYSYSSYVSVSTKDYTYTSIIDVSKEDYRDSQARLNQQELYFNRYEKTGYTAFIFSIGVIEETFRSNMLNKTYHDNYGVEYNYDSDKYIIFTIVTSVEFIFSIIIIILKCLNKWKKN